MADISTPQTIEHWLHAEDGMYVQYILFKVDRLYYFILIISECWNININCVARRITRNSVTIKYVFYFLFFKSLFCARVVCVYKL